MTKLVIRAFGGMLPALDTKLLPDSNATESVNSWLYSGSLQGFRAPRAIHTLVNPQARTVFRVPRGQSTVESIDDSNWLEFEYVNTTVVRSPVTSQDDPRYYWADGIGPPKYTTKSRLEHTDPVTGLPDPLPPLLLGVPRPGVPPGVSPTGGASSVLETRAYVYTWVTALNEEGPPSEPSAIVTAKMDATWNITVSPPSVSDTTGRDLKYTNIYRTATGSDGTAQFFRVAQIPIAQLTFADAIPTVALTLFQPLFSTFWTGPPSDLEGLVSLPNGMIAGWRRSELWYCEPFRPHAWPAPYQTSVDFPIVGMAALDQMLVIGTENVAFSATGVHPAAVSLRMITGSEPCLSQGSMVSTPQGVLYAGPNGLIRCTTGGAENVTREFISTDKWHELLLLNQLHAAVMNGAYYCYSATLEPAFQADAFQNDAFQVLVPQVAQDGALIELRDRRVAFTKLQNPLPTHKVLQDVWTAEVLLVRDGKVWLHSLVEGEREPYAWISKVFQLSKPQNLTVMKIVAQGPPGVDVGQIDFYANGQLRMSRTFSGGSKPFRLPSGYKVDNMQIWLGGVVAVDQIELASTMKELSEV